MTMVYKWHRKENRKCRFILLLYMSASVPWTISHERAWKEVWLWRNKERMVLKKEAWSQKRKKQNRKHWQTHALGLRVIKKIGEVGGGRGWSGGIHLCVKNLPYVFYHDKSYTWNFKMRRAGGEQEKEVSDLVRVSSSSVFLLRFTGLSAACDLWLWRGLIPQKI